MNYLAHAFLSLENEEIQVGNMMGDFIKGNKFLLYPDKIKQGILLHRSIDSFTDGHPLIHESIHYFKPSFRLSGGIFVDILFDHFLANDKRYFTEETLINFTSEVYKNLMNRNSLFDENMKRLFSYMTTYNWLYNYKYYEGLTKSIIGICKRHPFLGEAETALSIIRMNYEELKILYDEFFPSLLNHVIASDK